MQTVDSAFSAAVCKEGSGVFEAVLLDFSALNVAQSNGSLPFHAFDVQEYVGVCGVRI